MFLSDIRGVALPAPGFPILGSGALSALLLLFSLLCSIIQASRQDTTSQPLYPVDQKAQGQEPVQMLGPGFPALDRKPGGQVLDKNRR